MGNHEWLQPRPPAPETSFLPAFAYRGEETRNTRTSLAALEAHIEEKNTPRDKTHSPPRTVKCYAMSHSSPRKKSPRSGRKIRDNHVQKFPSSNNPKQNVAQINVNPISRAPPTSTTIICRNCLSHGIPALHDHNTIRCTKEQQIFCYKCGRVGYRTPDCPTPKCKVSKKPPGNVKRAQR